MSIQSEIDRINSEVYAQMELIDEIIDALLTKVASSSAVSATDADSTEE